MLTTGRLIPPACCEVVGVPQIENSCFLVRQLAVPLVYSENDVMLVFNIW
jgi:hypothetical protein